MRSIPKEEIILYSRHVHSNDFSPFIFPESWRNLKAHPDSAPGIKGLQSLGFKCIALSNGSKDLIEELSRKEGIGWDHIVDLVAHKVYKPHKGAYRTVEADLGIPPAETLMVSSNGTFGDIEGSTSVGMKAVVIRDDGIIPDIVRLYDYFYIYKNIDLGKEMYSGPNYLYEVAKYHADKSGLGLGLKFDATQ